MLLINSTHKKPYLRIQFNYKNFSNIKIAYFNDNYQFVKSSKLGWNEIYALSKIYKNDTHNKINKYLILLKQTNDNISEINKACGTKIFFDCGYELDILDKSLKLIRTFENVTSDKH